MTTQPTPPSPLRNAPQLITYVDRLAGDLVGLGEVMRGPLSGAFGGTHLLPFFPPIDGSDAGFDPIDHTQVDARLGVGPRLVRSVRISSSWPTSS